MGQYQLRVVDDECEWQRLFLEVPRPHLPQAWQYGEAKRLAEGWRPIRCMLQRVDRPQPKTIALCQILEKRAAGVPLVSRVNRGPLFIDDGQSPEERAEALRAFRRGRRRVAGGLLMLAPAWEDGKETRDLLRRAGFMPRRAGGWASSGLDLRDDESRLFERLSSRWKRNLKAAFKRTAEHGALVVDGSVDWLLQMHQDNQNDRGFVGPPLSLIRSLHDYSPRDFSILTLRVEKEAVAMLATVRFGVAAEYYLGWNGERGRKMNSGVALLWHAVLKLKHEGVTWFDLGGYGGDPNAGFNELKRGMNGTDYVLSGEWIGY